MDHDDYFFWDMNVQEVMYFGTGVVLGSGLEIAVAVGKSFPCVGQISEAIESGYYLFYYIGSLLFKYDTIMLFNIFLH